MPPVSGPADQQNSNTEAFYAETADKGLEAAEPSPICPECGAHNREAGLFCAQCGAPLARYCHQCGSKITATVEICERCGARQQDLSAAEACQRCGSRIDDGSEFCQECGARLLITCPQCGALIGASLNFCTGCGFNYSRFVTERLAAKPGKQAKQVRESSYFAFVSSAIMIALVMLSIVLIVYIVAQI